MSIGGAHRAEVGGESDFFCPFGKEAFDEAGGGGLTGMNV